MKHITTKWLTNIFAEVDTYKSNGSKTTKVIEVGEVNKVRYIDNEAVATVEGRVTAINVEVLKDANGFGSTVNPVDTIKDDINILSIEFDCSKEYDSNIVVVNPKEIIEDARVTTATKVTVTPNIKVAITVVSVSDKEEESSVTVDDIKVGTEISPFKFKTIDGQIINDTVTVCKFLYNERPEGKVNINAMVIKDTEDKIYTVEFKNILSLNEEAPIEEDTGTVTPPDEPSGEDDF